MKRLLFFFSFTFLCLRAFSQANPRYPVDTVPKGMAIMIGTTVFSFNATIFVSGIALERHYNGPMLFDIAYLKPGAIVLVDHVMAYSIAGAQIRLPDKKYVVR